jgi:hypothetical protein
VDGGNGGEDSCILTTEEEKEAGNEWPVRAEVWTVAMMAKTRVFRPKKRRKKRETSGIHRRGEECRKKRIFSYYVRSIRRTV